MCVSHVADREQYIQSTLLCLKNRSIYLFGRQIRSFNPEAPHGESDSLCANTARNIQHASVLRPLGVDNALKLLSLPRDAGMPILKD
jgi:hypothetical protein